MQMPICSKCGGGMERGLTTAAGLIGGDTAEGGRTQLVFVVPGAATSSNPVAAFKQGLADEPTSRRYGIVGARCSSCGFIELYGEPDTGL